MKHTVGIRLKCWVNSRTFRGYNVRLISDFLANFVFNLQPPLDHLFKSFIYI